jgi:RNA recognition motif-containing protein
MEFNTYRKLNINGNDVRVGWGKNGNIPNAVQTAVQSGATRNVYLGNLEEDVTEEELKDDLDSYGHIEQIKIVPEKHCAFVHFTSISAAVSCVTNLPTEAKWETRRVNYGKDRCAYNPKQGANQSMQQQTFNFQNPFQFGYDPYGNSRNPQMASQMMSQSYMTGNSATSTTVYLGNIHPDTTCEEICNAIRGGILYQIRYLDDKHIAFVTFMDATAAFNFHQLLSYQGISIKGRRLKGGWGKPVQIPSSIIMAVQSGASRNIYIGNLDETITEEKLRTDFSEYGDIELINFLNEKSCAFVNFTSIQSAINALEGIKNKDDYKKLKINFGKDRCGNPPRLPKANGNGVEVSGTRSREGQPDAVAAET